MQRIFPPASVSRPALGPTQPPVQWVPGVKRGRGVTLTTHPHLVPRSRMSRSYTSSPLKRLHGMWWDNFSLSLTLNDDRRNTLASLGYADSGRSSYSERQQCQQYLCANKLRTPVFGRRFFQKNMLGVFEKIRYYLDEIRVSKGESIVGEIKVNLSKNL
jgi:hypothetical protein